MPGNIPTGLSTSNMKDYREISITTLAGLFEYAEVNFADLPALKMLGGESYTYAEFAAKSRELSRLMSSYGLGSSEKVAIYSQNMPNWTVAYFSAVTFGRVVVPILAESAPNEVENIILHSESSVLFVSSAKLPSVTQPCLDALKLVICLDDFHIVKCDLSVQEQPAPVSRPSADDLAGIFYTSGTTGRAKGVMLSHGNLYQNVIAASYAYPGARKGYNFLSILPMAHTYEMSFGMLYPIYVGACVNYISKPPTPSVLLGALAKVRPQVMLSVPLIIDKIYKGSVRKTIDGSKFMTWMDKHCQRLLYRIVGIKLKKTFGGRLEFFGIGGAKLDPVVEDFLQKAKFPYAIGYGLTETAPLITYTNYRKPYKVGSLGKHAYRVKVRLGDVNKETGEGEIQCKGPNVMLGYYKDPERTASVFTEDGWFRTGDLATMTKRGVFSIKGRLGSMIVGASGENIYPEEIESVINSFPHVVESLVVKRDGKLVGLIKFDEVVEQIQKTYEDAKEAYNKASAEGKVKLEQSYNEAKKKWDEVSKSVIEFVNRQTRKSNNIQSVEAVKEPFIKTATMKIKRLFYK